jgi:fructose-bisphosphate aldolase class II
MTRQSAQALLLDAQANRYAVGAFNVHSVETTEALLWAADEAEAPVILQVGKGIVPHVGLTKATEMVRRVLAESEAEAFVHLDHGTLEQAFAAIRLGYDSVMYDGAALSLDENIANTRRVVEVARIYGVAVEAELGRIPDVGASVDWSSYYTDPDEAGRFVRETGVDWLAVSVGVMHGVATGVSADLDIPRVRALVEATGVPLVLHGVSGLSGEQIGAAIDAGIHKLNTDTDLRNAFRAGIEAVWSADGDRVLEQALAEGRTRMQAATVEKLRLFRSAGRVAVPAGA